tara:strand:+ start:3789 stop:3926 length:138 start_codon:yes stop_codon:yes gene_type:complete
MSANEEHEIKSMRSKNMALIIEHPYNARICGWFGAQRKTSPTTCA